MSKISFFGILGLTFFLTSCSSHLEKESPPDDGKKTVKADHTFIELINEDEVRLIFRGVENPKPVELTLYPGITQEKLGAGYWELIGFHFQKRDFQAMNDGKRFVLRVKKNQNTYGGTFIIGCPKVPNDKNNLLKEMSFFDRYSFRSNKGLCEVIVGNRLKKIQINLNTFQESNGLKVEEGF